MKTGKWISKLAAALTLVTLLVLQPVVVSGAGLLRVVEPDDPTGLNIGDLLTSDALGGAYPITALAATADEALAVGTGAGVFWIVEPDAPGTLGVNVVLTVDSGLTGGSPITALAGLPDGKVAVGTQDGYFRVVGPGRLEGSAVLFTKDRLGGNYPITALAARPDGKVAVGTGAGVFWIVEPDAPGTLGVNVVLTVDGVLTEGSPITALSALPDGTVAVASDNILNVVTNGVLEGRAVVRTDDSAGGDITALAGLPDGTLALGIVNMPPVADAGDDQIFECVNPDEGVEDVILDGSGSFDPDGDPLTYKWYVDFNGNGRVDGEDVLADSGEIVHLGLVINTEGFDLVLVVTDSVGQSSRDAMSIIIEFDEDFTFDTDGDGHSTPDSCLGTKDDCDDNDATVYPGAPELCDGKDNNCDGVREAFSDAELLTVCKDGRDIVAIACGVDVNYLSTVRTTGKQGQGKGEKMSCIAHEATAYVDSLVVQNLICSEDADEMHSCIVSYFASGGKSQHFGE